MCGGECGWTVIYIQLNVVRCIVCCNPVSFADPKKKKKKSQGVTCGQNQGDIAVGVMFVPSLGQSANCVIDHSCDPRLHPLVKAERKRQTSDKALSTGKQEPINKHLSSQQINSQIPRLLTIPLLLTK